MEDHFDKLIYLVVGIIYFMLNNSKSDNADDKTVIDQPSECQPAPTSSTKWANTWKHEAKNIPGAGGTLSQTVIKKISPNAIRRTPPQLATQQPSSKKIDRVLRRYGSWKKAIIMAELMQPRSQHAPYPTPFS